MLRRRTTRWLGRLLIVAGLLLVVFVPATAWAQNDYPLNTTTPTTACPTVGGAEVCGTSVTLTRNAAVTTSSGSLPFTGGDVALLTVLGLVVVVAGGGLVFLGRRSASTSS